jgi:hypothetical protein
MQQTTDWLKKLGLGQYARRFAENDITFVILPDLTDQDLEKIGVASLGHRRLLLRAIAELKGAPELGTAAATPVAPHDTADLLNNSRANPAAVRVNDQANACKVLPFEDVDDIGDVCVEIDLLSYQMRTLSESGEGW